MKRILIITYYWPPSGGSGVQRWLKLAKYLDRLGCEVIVYTPENPSFNIKDESLLNDVSDGIKILKTKIWEPYKLLSFFSKKKELNAGLVDQTKNKSLKSKILNWIRGNLFIPDPRKFWIRPSVQYLNSYLKQSPVDYLITTGPPHSMHLIGLKLKQKFDFSWIMDIRDPWSKLDFLDNFRVSQLARRKYERLEKSCLSAADGVLATSYSMPEMLLDFDQTKFKCIPNGFDEEDFNTVEILKENESFELYHAGLLNNLRNPTELWQAIREMSVEENDFNNRFKLRLVGNIDPAIVNSIQVDAILKQLVVIEGYKTHNQILADYNQSDALLLLINNSPNYKVNIPAKLFEYIASKKAILSIGKNDADANIIIKRHRLGYTADYGEKNEIKNAIRKLMDKNHSLETINSKLFSRKTQAQELIDWLRDLKKNQIT